jgi:hypothetical protein
MVHEIAVTRDEGVDWQRLWEITNANRDKAQL